MEEQLLDDAFSEREVVLKEASKGKRFANFLIDYFGAIVVMFLFFITLELTGVYSLETETPILDQVLGMLGYAAYYLLIEGLTKGKSLGKYITRTRVVDIEGRQPDFGTIVKRSFSRVVPFEPFSYLGDKDSGWHDRWSDTMVIDEKQSVLPLEDSFV